MGPRSRGIGTGSYPEEVDSDLFPGRKRDRMCIGLIVVFVSDPESSSIRNLLNLVFAAIDVTKPFDHMLWLHAWTQTL